jgi:hypothetical protein
MADADRGMQIAEGRAAGGARETVRHRYHRRLLQAKDVAEVVRPVVEERQFGRTRIAEHGGHIELAQQVDGRVANGDHAGRCFRHSHTTSFRACLSRLRP